jgi:transposase
MYRDVQQWLYIRSLVLEKGKSRKQVVRETGISRKTVRKMLADPLPPPAPERRPDGLRKPTQEGARNERRRARAAERQAAQAAAQDWMRRLAHGRLDKAALRQELAGVPDLDHLLDRARTGTPAQRRKALAILCLHRGYTGRFACAYLGLSKTTLRRYRETFARGGVEALLAKQHRSTRKTEDEATKAAVFRTLHEPPSTHGFNRTSWRMADLCAVLSRRGTPACPQVVRAITKAAGYRWCKARTVLTSSDPEYAEKLTRIRAILGELQPNEAFFSIDEFGPFAVRMRAGCRLVPPGEVPTIPKWQQSRGSLILTAALELSGNQITHFYSDAKNTAEMTRMLDLLVVRYRDRRRIFLSWDAASWHVSKKLNARIAEHNESAEMGGGPLVVIAPLPSGAQFLNVIEAVFNGMARAIIHNSDYADVEAAKAAIDRYIADRNAAFRRHPQRAGRKIWGKEPAAASFSEAGNFKDPLFLR